MSGKCSETYNYETYPGDSEEHKQSLIATAMLRAGEHGGGCCCAACLIWWAIIYPDDREDCHFALSSINDCRRQFGLPLLT